MAPMVLLPRFLTYYPPIVLATVLGATGLALWGVQNTDDCFVVWDWHCRVSTD